MANNEVTNQEGVKLEKRPQNKISPEQQKKQQQILFILIIVVVIGALFILYRNGLIGGSTGREPVEQYLKAIAAKDFDTYVASMPGKMAEDYFNDKNAKEDKKDDEKFVPKPYVSTARKTAKAPAAKKKSDKKSEQQEPAEKPKGPVLEQMSLM